MYSVSFYQVIMASKKRLPNESKDLAVLCTDWVIEQWPTLSPADKMRLSLFILPKTITQKSQVNTTVNIEQVQDNIRKQISKLSLDKDPSPLLSNQVNADQ